MIPKIRAYDKVTQKIFDVEYINFTEQVVNLGGCRRRYFHEVENMQSTGLTDKKGDEIYEGDIVRIVQNGVRVLGEIKKDSFMWYVFDFAYKFEGSLYDIYRTCELEVIGNIYENPELLEG